MENKTQKTGIEIRNSSDIRIEDNRFEGLDVAIDAENTRDLKMKSNVINSRIVESQIKPKWYRDRHFLIAVIAIIVTIAVAWLW